MTRERAQEMLPIIKAFAEGNAVQWKGLQAWINTTQPTFDPSLEWRVKSEAREWWLCEECDRRWPFGLSREVRDSHIPWCSKKLENVVHVKEVLPEGGAK